MRDFINIIKLVEYEIDDEEETPSEREAYQRVKNIEAAVTAFCERELGWSFDRSNAVYFDADSNELHIDPEEGDYTLDALTKLASLGDVKISGGARQWDIAITILTPPGFNITPQ